MERIVFIDVAKAICIILVVIGHYIPGHAPDWYVALHDVIYTFHMPLFMFASGYVYRATRKDTGYGSFIAKKARRLLVPYLTTSVIVITLKLLSQGGWSVDHPVSFLSYARMFYQPEAGRFLWFVWALWWMFVIVPLFKTPRSRLVLFGATLVLHYVPLPLPQAFCFSECKHMFVFFMLGVVVAEEKWLRNLANTFSSCRTACATVLFVVLNYINLTQLGGVKIPLVAAVLPYLGIWFTLEVSKLACRCCRISPEHKLMKVAASSYIIYLFHTTFEGFAKAVLRKLPLDAGAWYVFVPEALLVITSDVVFPMLLYAIFKKHKATRCLFGL